MYSILLTASLLTASLLTGPADIDCHRVYAWLRHKPDAGSPKDPRACDIGCLTGQDSAALEAFVHLVSLYTRSDEHGRAKALTAMRACVEAAQDRPQVRRIFRESIAMVYDWEYRAILWRKMFGADLGDGPDRLFDQLQRAERAEKAQDAVLRGRRTGFYDPNRVTDEDVS